MYLQKSVVQQLCPSSSNLRVLNTDHVLQQNREETAIYPKFNGTSYVRNKTEDKVKLKIIMAQFRYNKNVTHFVRRPKWDWAEHVGRLKDDQLRWKIYSWQLKLGGSRVNKGLGRLITQIIVYFFWIFLEIRVNPNFLEKYIPYCSLH